MRGVNSEEWKWILLEDVAEVTGGITLGRAVSGSGTVEVPYLRVANVQDGYLDLSDVKTIRIFASEEDRYLLRAGDVLMNEGGDYDKLGRGTVWQNEIPRCSHQNHVFRVRCREDLLRPWFLAAVSGSYLGKRYFIRSSKQTTNLATINSTQIKAFRLPLPPLREQDRIIEILSAVDEAIRKTEQLIAKLEQVKQGLLHDLLTRGIDDNGELRDPDRHPEQFKDSVLGRIPKGWKVYELAQLVDPRRPIVYGILMPGRGCRDGIPVVKVKDIIGGEVKLADLLLTSPAIDAEYRRSRLRTGDLLFTIRGTVGRTAFVPQRLDQANITQDTARIAIQRANPVFVRQYIEMPVPQRFIETHTIGVAVKGINLRDVRRIPMADPPRTEADEIAHRLSAADIRIASERIEASKLRLLKQGLMEDLLTGGVRVTPLLDDST